MSETELIQRLERLERDSRRLKTFSLMVLVLAAALGGIYATQPVPQKVTAHEFDIVDSSGKVRIKIYARYPFGGDNPAILLTDPQGKQLVSLNALYGTGGLDLSNTNNKASIGLGSNEQGPIINFLDAQGNPRMYFKLDASDEPSITLSDSQGYSMGLGSALTVRPTTGEKSQTSAASIVMFGNDKDHHLIWRAP